VRRIRTEPLILTMNFQDGNGTLKVDLDHPLVTVFRRAVKTGKYTGDWLYLIVRPSAAEKPKLLGTVAWTPRGERFLFFPGKPVEVLSTHLDKSPNGNMLDHITLEFDETMSRYSEHIKILGCDTSKPQRHTRGGCVRVGELHPWFSLLLQNLNEHEDLPAIFKFEFDAPSSDISRLAEEAMFGRVRQRSATAFPAPESDGPHYFQLDVWAGRGDGWKSKYADYIPWYLVKGRVDGHRGEIVTSAAQYHDFGDDCGILIALTRPSGSLTSGGIFHISRESMSRNDD
jgi:hypothetical protein